MGGAVGGHAGAGSEGGDVTRLVPYVVMVPEGVPGQIEAFAEQRYTDSPDPEATDALREYADSQGWTLAMLLAGGLLAAAIEEVS